MRKTRNTKEAIELAEQVYGEWTDSVVVAEQDEENIWEDEVEEEFPLSGREEEENSTPRVVVVKKIDVDGVSVITRPMTAKELKAFEESRGV